VLTRVLFGLLIPQVAAMEKNVLFGAKYLCNCRKNYFFLNPAGCCNSAKMYRSEQNICIIVAKIIFT
jgi:hypothetical protein